MLCHLVGGAGSQAIRGGGRGYLSPALEVIHSRPWHKLEPNKKKKDKDQWWKYLIQQSFLNIHNIVHNQANY